MFGLHVRSAVRPLRILQGGTSGNAINGVAPKNPKRAFYENEANKEFGG